jgi:hypothetical protein
LLILLSMFLQLNVPNVFLAEPVKILPRSSNNESIIAWSVTPIFDFDILESSKLFSDVHAPLHILLSVNLNNNDSNSNTVRKTNHSKAKIKSYN